MRDSDSFDQLKDYKETLTAEEFPIVPDFTFDDILHAIDSDQFYLVAQCQVNLESLELVGFEFLARWQHKQYGELLPFHFIPVLEDIKQCHILTLHLFQRMLGVVEQLQEKSSGLHFSLNISAYDLLRADFANEIINIASQYDIDYHSIVLEVTETAEIFGHISVANLRKLKTFGLQLAVDDFWNGFSTLETIRLNLFSEIKIDYSLTSKLINDKTSMAGINAILQLSSNLGHRCIVEGIETCMVRSVLLEAGALYGQGFLFSKGVRDQELEQWIDDNYSESQKVCASPRIVFEKKEREQLEARPHPSWTWDFSAERITWANRSAVIFWRAESQEDLLQRDMSKMSYLAKTRLKSYQLRLEGGERGITSEWDFFPGGYAQKMFCIQVPRIDPQSGRMIMLVNAFEGFHSRLPPRKYIDSSNEFPVPFVIANRDGRLIRINKHAHIEIDIKAEHITDIISKKDFNLIKAKCKIGHMVQSFARVKGAQDHKYFYVRTVMLPDINQSGQNIFHIVLIPVSDLLTDELYESLNRMYPMNEKGHGPSESESE